MGTSGSHWVLRASLAVLLLAPGLAQADPLKCRAQVVLKCESSECSEANQPVDLTLDFDKETGTVCQGEQCDDGQLASVSAKGQWDSQTYTGFKLRAGWSDITGTLTPDRRYFAGSSDDLGQLAGSCGQ